MDNPAILWFRQDLRLHDNPALMAALKTNCPIIPVYILEEPRPLPLGGASRWWLHHSLSALNRSLREAGAALVLKRGSAKEVLQQLIAQTGAKYVFWNRRYDAAGITVDKEVKESLSKAGITCESFNSHLLFEPWTIKNKQGKPFQVFTRFWNYCLEQGSIPRPLLSPRQINGMDFPSDVLETWGLLPTKPDWAHGLRETWQPGEVVAVAKLQEFLKNLIVSYKDDRNFPDLKATSHLSPHLTWGEISPRVIYYGLMQMMQTNPKIEQGGYSFLSEIGWREFSYHLLFHFPEMPTTSLRSQFRNFPWREDEALFTLWTKGLTGYPIVDAGMRDLWQTGWMHNRVRMIVASFLTKDLLLPWQKGATWFWDTLVDADIANNSTGWQWVSGCGVDAAPYFRIFNPVLQGEKFDPQGEYIRCWIPELRNLPNDIIHKPWKASPERLKAAGVQLGVTYPQPIVDHEKARKIALEVFRGLFANKEEEIL